MKLLGELWKSGVPAETQQKDNVKMLTQLQKCENESIPLAAIVGKDELDRGFVKLREVETRREWNVKRENVVQEIKAALKKN